MQEIHVFNIQHFSVHDGPGVRTVIFFKGCNLQCKWCHNPESLSVQNDILLYPEKCIGCGECIKSCPLHCHTFDANGTHQINRKNCRKCFACCETCYAEALVQVGETRSLDYIFDEIVSNQPYFNQSGGGVTFSGGECMLQIEGLSALLKKCRVAGIHTAVDTAGNVPWSFFETILPDTDLFLYDIKAFDPQRHKELTGDTNERILLNLEQLILRKAHVLVRIPYVVGYNDDQLADIASYLSKFPDVPAELLPFHAMGSSKYTALGQDSGLHSPIPEKETIVRLKQKYHFL